MALWTLAKLLAVALVGVEATQNASDSKPHIPRRLDAVAPGNVAACYTPFHNPEYPLNRGGANVDALRNAIDQDFSLMSKHFTHVRTYYAQHFGIQIAPIAAKYGMKLYLGAFLTNEYWWNDEANAAANAIKNYAGTVEAVFVGSENLVDFKQRSWDIIDKINDIKKRAGSAAGNVKYGTAQRVNEFLDSRFDWDMQQLDKNLDILGVNIYPFFNNDYDASKPTDLLDAQWNAVINKYSVNKVALTETGFPSAGKPSSISPRVQPSLDGAVNYYRGVVGWTPRAINFPKFWFQAYDRRPEDPAASPDLEQHWGAWTTQRWTKREGYPLPLTSGSARSTSGGSCPIEEGQDYSGADVGNKPSSQAEGCFAICNQFNGCGAFTWTSYNGGTCWLKSGKGNANANNGARSGVAGLEANVDYNGNDVGNTPGANAQACISACQNASGCRAFTWTNYNSGTCWLKSARGSTSYSAGATSGVVC